MFPSLFLIAAQREATPSQDSVADLGLLSPEPSLQLDGGARASLRREGGALYIDLVAPGGRLQNVRLVWPQTADAVRALSGRRLRLTFSAQSSNEATVRVHSQLRDRPYTTEGLDQTIRLTTEWKPYAFDFQVSPVSGRAYNLPAFFLGGTRGTVGLRAVSLGAVERPLLTLKDVFAWHDELPARFQARALADIVEAWSPGYTDTVKVPTAFVVTGRALAVSNMQTQIAYRGEFSNGPSQVLVRSVEAIGDNAVVKGYWSGSWRISRSGQGSFLDASGKPLPPVDAGESFAGDFTVLWKRSPEGWKQTSVVHGPYRKLEEDQEAQLKATHEALKGRPIESTSAGGLRVGKRLLPMGADAAAADAVFGKPFAVGTMPIKTIPGTKFVMGEVYDYRLYKAKGLKEVRVYLHHDWKGEPHARVEGAPEPRPGRLAAIEFAPSKGQDWKAALRTVGVPTGSLRAGAEHKGERRISGLRGLPPATTASWSPPYYLKRGDAHVVLVSNNGWSY